MTRTDDDIVKRLVGDLVNCSEHDEGGDALEATVKKLAIYVKSRNQIVALRLRRLHQG